MIGRGRGGRSRSEGGSAAVEAALVTPFILLLMIAIVEFGMYFKDNLSVSDAVKAGVRLASAEARTSTYAQDAADRVQEASGAINPAIVEELWVYKANTGNEFPSGYSNFSNCTTCVKFRWNGTRYAPTYSGWAAINQVACATGPPDRVGVYMKARHPSVTNMIFTSLTINQSNVIRLEPIPAWSGCMP